MKTFIQWAEGKNLDLPVLIDNPVGKKTIDEKTKRGGIAHWAYPDAYVRQQYTDDYFVPIAADAIQKMGTRKVDRNG